MGLKCKNCGGDLYPAKGAAMCECRLCGTVQAVPAEDGENQAEKEAEKAASLQKWLDEREEREKARQEEERRRAEEQRKLEAAERQRKIEEQLRANGSRKIRTYSASRPDTPSAEEAPDDSGNTDQTADRKIQTYRAKAGAEKAPGKETGKPPAKEETSARKEERRPVGIRRQARTDETGREAARQEGKRKIIILAVCVAAIALLAAGGYLLTRKPQPESKPTQAPAATAAPAPTATLAPEPTATLAPETTATPSPEPTAAASPEPTATAAPEPTTAPSPEPTPTAASEPTATAAADEITEEERNYRRAEQYLAEGNLSEAEAILAGLAGWKDADELLDRAREEMADRAAEAGDYETAIEFYNKLNNRSDATVAKLIAANKGKNYLDAMAALETGDLDAAYTKLVAAGNFRDAAEQLGKLNVYRRAAAAMAEGRYRDARTDYVGLGDYLGSAESLEACNAALYREAAERKESGDNAGAYELFSLISGYLDSGEITAGMDADYEAALAYIAAGEKIRAEELLAGLTGWKDADGTLETLREEIADDAAAAGNYETAIAWYGKLGNRTEATEAKLFTAIQAKNYHEAMAALEAGDLDAAQAGFTAAGEYRDAAEQAGKLAEYRKAEALLAEGDVGGAIETFRSIPDYRDSAGRADALCYERAGTLRDSGDLPAAMAEYKALGGYSDAPDMMLQVLDEIANGYIAAGDYGAAMAAYLEQEQTGEIREREYSLAQRCYDGGYYAEATAAYEALGQYKLSLSKLAVARYAWADQLFSAGEYEKAAEQFSLLDGMSDSAARADESIYQLACGLLENGRYDEAKERFAAIAGFSDADTMAKECDYRKAISLSDGGQIREAQELFESLGTYSDSRTRADMCIYARAEELFAAENYAEARDLYGSIRYLDSAEKYGQCVYILADALLEAGRYGEAKELFRSVSYGDSAEKANASGYREAEEYYDAGRFAEAEKGFLELGGYLDSADRAGDARLQQGNALMEAGDYEGALAIFETAGYGDSAAKAARCHYELGYAAHAAGKPDEAVSRYARALDVPEAAEAVMAAAKDYIAVKEMEKAIRTLWLIRDRDEAKTSLMEIAALEQQAGNPALAVLAYTSTGDSSLPELRQLLEEVPYEAFAESVQPRGFLPDETAYADSNIYTYAEALFGAGLYDAAASAFQAAGDYAGAAERVTEAIYLHAKDLYDAGDYAAAYAEYRKVKGYRDTDELLAADAHLAEARIAPYVTTGNIVTFGSYEQDNDLSNGPEQIEWIVLEARNGKALLLSRYGLDAQPYNTQNTGITWARSSLRAWLNEEFLGTAFSPEEQAAIATANLSNGRDQGYWRTSGGKDTQDRVFLLSYAEANKYLGVTYKNSKNEKPRTSPTAYAIARGAETSSNIHTEDGREVGLWWLRSPGLNEQSAAHIHNGGSVYYRGVNSASLMVRPAILLDLSSDIF